MKRKHEESTPPYETPQLNPEDHVCYGALRSVHVATWPGFKQDHEVFNDDGFGSFILSRRNEHHVLLEESGTPFAFVDTRTSNMLSPIDGIEGVICVAIVDTKGPRAPRKRQQSLSSVASINIYGRRDQANQVGELLSEAGAFLQHPSSVVAQIEYDNPQYYKVPDQPLDMSSLIGMLDDSPTARRTRIYQELGNILDSLTHVDREDEWIPPQGLKSSLREHQKDGVCFILQRESHQYCEKLISSFQERRIADKSDQPEDSCVGGLLADAMGLGKTLTMLTAILQTLQMADYHSKFSIVPEDTTDAKFPVKGTLVVVPSSQLLDNWISEIDLHIADTELSILKFHGSNRPRVAADLRNADVVFTTYATLATDFAAHRVLYQCKWFRVVLDEAHWIRNPTSRQYQAAVNISSTSRWCLTGTPIQNKLEDLTSLASFLKLAPFPSRKSFQNIVIGSLAEKGRKFAVALRNYLQAYCLRRLDESLDLRPPLIKTIDLELSPPERQIYQEILRQTRIEIDSLVSTRNPIKKFNKLFMASLKLRRMCNLGTSLPGQRGLVQENAGFESCEVCSQLDDESCGSVFSDSLCPACSRPLLPPSPRAYTGPSMEPNDRSSQDRGDSSSDEGAYSNEMEVDGDDEREACTKLEAVVHNVMLDGKEDKSLVFSYWTATLDKLRSMLVDRGIGLAQIDGRVGHLERNRRLSSFRTDPKIQVLLMTIETGGVGLNLTAANRVHIVEPQWNPAIEQQAIARALRMGQQREVTIYRYVVRKSVEQNIIDLQRKKEQLAKITFDTRADEDVGAKLKDLKFILDLDTS